MLALPCFTVTTVHVVLHAVVFTIFLATFCETGGDSPSHRVVFCLGSKGSVIFCWGGVYLLKTKIVPENI